MDGFHRDDQGDWVAELECGHNHESLGPTDLDAGAVQAIRPLMAHHVETLGPASVRIDFFRVAEPADQSEAEGGDPACWAHLVCAGCGAVVDRPGAHRPGCPEAGGVG